MHATGSTEHTHIHNIEQIKTTTIRTRKPYASILGESACVGTDVIRCLSSKTLTRLFEAVTKTFFSKELHALIAAVVKARAALVGGCCLMVDRACGRRWCRHEQLSGEECQHEHGRHLERGAGVGTHRHGWRVSERALMQLCMLY